MICCVTSDPPIDKVMDESVPIFLANMIPMPGLPLALTQSIRQTAPGMETGQAHP